MNNTLHKTPIVISRPELLRGEAETIAALISCGASPLHLRKPQATPQQWKSLLSELIGLGVDPQHLTLHHQAALAREYGCGGVHLRICDTTPEELSALRREGFRVSLSAHSFEEVEQWSALCDYLFLSPLFDSISKQGYGSNFTLTALERLRPYPNVVGLGGIERSRIEALWGTPLSGIALLGAVWGESKPSGLDCTACVARFGAIRRRWMCRLGALQLISNGDLSIAEAFLKGGGRWIQLRMKGSTPEQIIARGRAFRALCDRYCALLLINDNPHLVEPTQADGVHVGREDISPEEARSIVGEGVIIGATTNTAEQILAHDRAVVDYVGLGPFRFTTTKERLAPTLGVEGYRNILSACNQATQVHLTSQAPATSEASRAEQPLPITAIGGIELSDCQALVEAGVRSIALSGAIERSENPEQSTAQFLEKLKTTTI